MKRILAALLLIVSTSAYGQSLSQLPAASQVNSTDLFYDVQTPGVGGVRATAQQILNFTLGSNSTFTGNNIFSGTSTFNGNATFKLLSSLTAGVTPTADGQNTLFQNGSKTAFNIYGPSAPASTFDYDNIRSVIDIESGTTVQNYNAFGSWIWNNVAATTIGGVTYRVGVGMENYCANIITGAECVGFNPALTDSFDATAGHSVASSEIGAEFDFSTYNSGTTVGGLSMVLQGTAQPTSAGGFSLAIAAGSTAKWTGGLTIADGALATGNAGIVLGLLNVASGTSISSDPITLNITDTGATEHHVNISAVPNGTASAVQFLDGGIANGLQFVNATTGNAVQLLAVGSDSSINLTLAAKGTSGGITFFAANTNMFDCNVTFGGFCTVTASGGLAMDGLNIVQVASLASNSASGYELLTGNAGTTAPTLLPNKTDTKAGIGADTAGDVSIIADNSGTATEILRLTGTRVVLQAAPQFASSTTGSTSQTFTNGPCTTSSTTAQWIPIAINGQSGTWFIPACH